MVGENTEIYSEDRETQALFQELNKGLDIQDFIAKNPVGRLLMAKVTEELLLARSQLEDVSPEDKKAIIAIQIKAKAARNVLNWLGEAIMSGKDAEAQLTLNQE